MSRTFNCHPADIAWYPIESIAGIFGVTPRTIWRDVEVLKILEIPGFQYIEKSGGMDKISFQILSDYRGFVKERKVQEAAMIAIVEKYG